MQKKDDKEILNEKDNATTTVQDYDNKQLTKSLTLKDTFNHS